MTNDSWQTKKLGDITVINGGGTPPTSHTEYFNGNVPWFTPSEITSGTVSILTDSRRQITEEATKFSKVAEQGTVLLSSRATIGNIGIVSNRSTYNQGIKGISPKEELNPWFLAYWLLANKRILEKSSFGTTFKELSTTALKRFDIAIPSIPVQQQIVEKLDAIKKLQELNQKEIEKIEKLFLSVVSKWFKPRSDWKVKKLEEITISIQNGYASRPISEENGKAQIRPHNVTREGLLTMEGIKYVPFVKKNNYLVKKGDIIFNNTNSAELVGKTAYIDEDIEAVFSNHMTRIRVDETKINPYFLATYLHTLYQSRYFQGLCTAWVNQAAINSTLLKGLKIPLPPIEEQKKIVDSLSALRDYKNTLRIEEEKLTELFESTLNKAMKGELIN